MRCAVRIRSATSCTVVPSEFMSSDADGACVVYRSFALHWLCGFQFPHYQTQCSVTSLRSFALHWLCGFSFSTIRSRILQLQCYIAVVQLKELDLVGRILLVGTDGSLDRFC